jgi:hypothetical protein
MTRCEAISPYDLSFFDQAKFVTVFTAYFDASTNGDVLTVGALLFRKKNIRPFERQWRAMLRKFGLPHFHMTDCNAEQGIYARLNEDPELNKLACIECATMAIKAVTDFAEKGAVWGLSITDFYETVTEKGFLPNPFAVCAWVAMADMMIWAGKNDASPRMFYVFESGDPDQAVVETLLRAIAYDDDRRARFRYEDHAFLPKVGSLPTQGADILAWQGAKHVRRRREGKHTRLRGDFDALASKLEITDGHMDRAFLEKIAAFTTEHEGVEIGGELAQLALLRNRSNARRTDARFAEILSRGG